MVSTRRGSKAGSWDLFPDGLEIDPADLESLDEDDARFEEIDEVVCAIGDALKDASVDARAQRIVCKDGSRLTIEETAARIASRSRLQLESVQFHVVGWLQTHYEPQGLDDEQMEEFEELIERWTDPYELND